MRIVPHVDVFLLCLWEGVSFTSYYSAILITHVYNNLNKPILQYGIGLTCFLS